MRRFLDVAVLHLALVAAFLSRGGICTPAAAPSGSPDKKEDGTKTESKTDLAMAQIDWLRSKKGGYFHESLKMVKLDESNPKSPMGLIVTADIEAGDRLMVIPQSALLTAGEDSYEMCDTALNLVHHRKLGDESEFAPYVKYLFDGNTMPPLPSHWSPDGMHLLRAILGGELPPSGITEFTTFRTMCGATYGDPELEEEAYQIVLRRSWDDKLLPLFDMANHRNGRWHNIDSTSAHDGNDIIVYARRDIQAGEDLYLSYNECTDCVGYHLTYVLQHILRDYSFVEQYPRRWIFRPMGDDLTFQIDHDPENPGQLKLEWLGTPSDRRWGPPETWGKYTTEVIRFLRGHYTRLKSLNETVRTNAARLTSEHEKSTILEFYDAILEAFSYAITSFEEYKDSQKKLCPMKEAIEDFNEAVENAKAEIVARAEAKAAAKAAKEAAAKEAAAKEAAAKEAAATKTDEINDEDDEDAALDDSIFDLEPDEEDELDVSDLLDTTCDYDDLTSLWPFDQIHSGRHSVCDVSAEWKKYGEYEKVGQFKSEYQEYTFYKRFSEEYDTEEEDVVEDTCLYINGVMNVCSSLRPQYHEILVHYSARFLDVPPKRSIFIGGGDNMVLHELLKYPSMEKVVGLELDQTITRASNVHFQVSPHFDNDKVEWYFGDAVKSILALPQDYFGTFDLVLVDLESPIIKMLKVTEELDIMDAALLLLAPGGIIVRNVDKNYDFDHRFTKHVLDLYYADMPMFCHQGLTLGSNTVDFLTKEPIDHGVETMYLQSIEKNDNKLFDKFYNYRTNSSHAVLSLPCCLKHFAHKRSTTTGGFGVLMILEAENTTLPLQPLSTVQDALSVALDGIGMKVTASMASEHMDGARGHLILALERGYIVARTWPQHNYIAFDVQVYGSTAQLENVRTALLKSVGSDVDQKSSSRYHLVTSGMLFLSEVPDEIEPESCTCVEEVVPDSSSIMEPSTLDLLLAESISLIQDENMVVVVLCGKKESQCTTLDALEKKKEEYGLTIVPIWECSDFSLENLASCESQTKIFLEGAAMDTKIGGLVISPDVLHAMGQVVRNILSSSKVRRDLLAENLLVLEASLDPSTKTWRTVLLDRFRTDMFVYDPAHRGELVFRDDNTNSRVELGVFSSGDRLFYSHLVQLVESIEAKTSFRAEVRTVKNGRNTYIPDFEPSHVFSQQDFDNRAAKHQVVTQKSLGMQTIFQFYTGLTVKYQLACHHLVHGLPKVFAELDYDDMTSAKLEEFKVGDGCIVHASWSEGNIVAVWDGRKNVVVNLFTHYEDWGVHDDFKHQVVQETPVFLNLSSRDEQPRGLGSIVNFERDCTVDDENVDWMNYEYVNPEDGSSESKGNRLHQMMHGHQHDYDEEEDDDDEHDNDDDDDDDDDDYERDENEHDEDEDHENDEEDDSSHDEL